MVEQELFDFIKCPVLYDIKYNKSIKIEENVTVPSLLDKIVKYFCLNLLDGTVISLDSLKKKWDSLCKANIGVITNKNNIDGFSQIYKFYKWAEKNQIIIADVNTPYSLIFHNQNKSFELRGNLGIILRSQNSSPSSNDNFELLVIDFSQKNPDQTFIDMKLKYTLDCYAFEKVFKKNFSGIRLHHIKTDKDFFSGRTKFDYDRLEKAIFNVASSAQQKLLFPREGYMCTSCNAKNYCKAWF